MMLCLSRPRLRRVERRGYLGFRGSSSVFGLRDQRKREKDTEADIERANQNRFAALRFTQSFHNQRLCRVFCHSMVSVAGQGRTA